MSEKRKYPKDADDLLVLLKESEQAFKVLKEEKQSLEAENQRLKEEVDEVSSDFFKLALKYNELKEYAQHKQECKLFGFTSFKKKTEGCTCGLDELLNPE